MSSKFEIAALVPELDVKDIQASIRIYCDVFGFSVAYVRPEEEFAYLTLGSAQLMLERADGPGRRFRTAPLEQPFGRGMNLQIKAPNVDELYKRVQDSALQIVVPCEDRWYRQDQSEVGNRQFVVADLDGYLLRFFGDLGQRPYSGD